MTCQVPSIAFFKSFHHDAKGLFKTGKKHFATNTEAKNFTGQRHEDFAILGQFCAKIIT